jgi:hypothetical protein
MVAVEAMPASRFTHGAMRHGTYDVDYRPDTADDADEHGRPRPACAVPIDALSRDPADAASQEKALHSDVRLPDERYDSDKMADVLHAAQGLERTLEAADADVILSTPVRCARKRRSACFLTWAGARAQVGETRSDRRCWRLRGEPGRRRVVARAYVDLSSARRLCIAYPP